MIKKFGDFVNESIWDKLRGRKPEEVEEVKLSEEDKEKIRERRRKEDAVRPRYQRFKDSREDKEEKIPCVYSILTKELVDRIRERRGKGPIGVTNDGYSFYCETESELANYKKIYKVGDKYKGETITNVSIGQEQNY